MNSSFSLRGLPSKALLTLVFAVVVFVSLQTCVQSMTCTRRLYPGHSTLEVFSCPDFMDKWDKQYCCGTEATGFCCRESKARKHGLRTDVSFNSSTGGHFERGFLGTLLTVPLIVGGCLICSCFVGCYLMERKGTSLATFSQEEALRVQTM